MIPLFKINVPKNIGAKLQEVFDSGMITEGSYSDQFEKEFGEFIGNKNVSLLNSGTSALSLAYRLCGVGPGKEVISSPMTCMATNEPIITMGGKIVWADIEPDTGNIDPASVEKLVTENTVAIVAVHWAGTPFNIDAINKIAKKYNIKVIEDAAHALGSTYNQKPIGIHSDYVCYSFQAIKHLTTVDGGALACKNEEDVKLARKLRWFGLDRKYIGSKWEQDITDAGYKMHMNNVNAAIGLEQMKTIQNVIDAHKKNAEYYQEKIVNPKIKKTKYDPESSYWIYTIMTENRQELKEYLLTNGIASDVVHIRNDRYSVCKPYQSQESLKGVEQFCNEMLCIPVGWWLSQDDLNKIVDVISKY
jgi:dTDP-4-amino-4,6-dideoxygalactose transaminase